MIGSRGVIRVFAVRCTRAVTRYGIVGTVALAVKHIVTFISSLRPSVRAEIRRCEERAAAFDLQFGVDTAGFIHPTQLKIDNPNAKHAVAYGGSDPEAFNIVIGGLPIEYDKFIFIDFGSGKGRAILLATAFPFKRVIGVEMSEELHRIAQENITRFRTVNPKCKDVQSVCADAVDYPLCSDPLVCYFCNPFDAVLMAQVVTNIRNSYMTDPRDIFIVYYNPKEAHVFDRDDLFNRFAASGAIRIWRTKREPRALDGQGIPAASHP